jgi:hypothetical protein
MQKIKLSLGLFFALLAMHAVLRHWRRMVSSLVVVSPLDPEYTRALLGEFRRVGWMTLSGTVVTGLAQGVLAAIGFWMTGVPQAALGSCPLSADVPAVRETSCARLRICLLKCLFLGCYAEHCDLGPGPGMARVRRVAGVVSHDDDLFDVAADDRPSRDLGVCGSRSRRVDRRV